MFGLLERADHDRGERLRLGRAEHGGFFQKDLAADVELIAGWLEGITVVERVHRLALYVRNHAHACVPGFERLQRDMERDDPLPEERLRGVVRDLHGDAAMDARIAHFALVLVMM